MSQSDVTFSRQGVIVDASRVSTLRHQLFRFSEVPPERTTYHMILARNTIIIIQHEEDEEIASKSNSI